MAYTIRTIPEEEVNQQKQTFQVLLQGLRQASSDEIDVVLAEREGVQLEEELSSEIVARLQEQIRNAAKA